MGRRKFCYACLKKTGHDSQVDIHGLGRPSGPLERIFVATFTLGASEAMADRYLQCTECGRVTRA